MTSWARLVITGGFLATTPLAAQVPVAPPMAETAAAPIEADGTVNVPSFRLPPSVYMSEEAKKALPREPEDYGPMLEQMVQSGNVAAIRESAREAGAAEIAALAREYRVRVEEGVLGGVHGVWALPETGARGAKGKVLVNLPLGAFIMGIAATSGMKESIPLVALTGYSVFSVDYRQAPEAQFPAASDDVVSVYRALLKDHKPGDIGIFGCSAGGLLTAQSLATFQNQGLPAPGAAGIFCASADARWPGDSWFWQLPIQGIERPPSFDERFYYSGHDLADPLMSPIMSDAVLARFPPTLIITAMRAGELSSAVTTHRLLVRNGVDAELHVWDGLGHAFFLNTALPESKEAFAVMARFFTKHLGGSK